MPGCRTWQEIGPTPRLNRDSPLAVGLTGVWPVGAISGPTVFDLAWGRNGTMAGTPTRMPNSIMGNVLQFNGTSERVDLPDSVLSLNAAKFTVAVWFATTTTSRVQLYSEGYTVTSTPFWLLDLNDTAGKLLFRNRDDSPTLDSIVSSIGSLNDGRPHLGVASWDGTTKRIFVDGFETASSTPSWGATTLDAAVIGAVYNGSGTPLLPYSGRMGFVTKWSRALSVPEMRAIYDPNTRFDLFWRKSRSAPKNTVAAGGTTVALHRANAGLRWGPFAHANAGVGAI